ncbi:MAG TPA: hypothetical protein DHW82_11535 [Spirochaetia bacterium]|nr:MAG: hypothetical protein A2Y41_01615 [Spirochaetes bacterium GWB1_36_13]HCL57624.1 hypothetical protein [Spirochaetia bacterium]
MKKLYFFLFCFSFLPFRMLVSQEIILATGEWGVLSSNQLSDKGLVSALVSLVFKKMDKNISLQFYNWKTCLTMTEKSEIFASFPFVYNEIDSSFVLYSEPLFYHNLKFFYVKKLKKTDIQSIDDLKDSKIGSVEGAYYEKKLREKNISLTLYPDLETALIRLLNGEIDLLPVNESEGWELIKKIPPVKGKTFKTLDFIFNQLDLRLLVSKNYPEAEKILKDFNQALIKVKKSKEYRQLLSKYKIEE